MPGRTLPVGNRSNKSQGFTYLIVLGAMVALAITAESLSSRSGYLARSEREAELLFRGMAYHHAIRGYYLAGRPAPTLPRSLSDLLSDPRFPNKRHIRALYPDPITDGEWMEVRTEDGALQGVFSRAGGQPLKRVNFPKGFEDFENAESYADWVFALKVEQ